MKNQNKQKEYLFSITKDDFEIQTFRSGGKGGQHQNTTDSGVRIIHKASGCTVESRSERSQHANKKIAFRQLVNMPQFKAWIKLESAARLKGYNDLKKELDESLTESNLKIEFYTPE